jgi:hypothetical protein
MNFDELSIEIPTMKKILDWYEMWPSFHDSEVVSIELSREGVSRIVVHAFVMTADTDSTGHYLCKKHARIHFVMSGVTNVELQGFNHQNVLSDLNIAKEDGGYSLVLYECYGVGGRISAEGLSIEIEPGLPVGSGYDRGAQTGVAVI